MLEYAIMGIVLHGFFLKVGHGKMSKTNMKLCASSWKDLWWKVSEFWTGMNMKLSNCSVYRTSKIQTELRVWISDNLWILLLAVLLTMALCVWSPHSSTSLTSEKFRFQTLAGHGALCSPTVKRHNILMGWDSPTSTITVFSSSRMFHC